jgi:hypothetical protein
MSAPDMARPPAQEFPKEVGARRGERRRSFGRRYDRSTLRMDEKDGNFVPQDTKNGNTGKLPSSLALTMAGSAAE